MLSRLFSPLAAGIAMAAVVGCGSSGYAPVSGVITFKGKPYTKAYVSFEPLSKEGEPGRASGGHTDENGRYTLRTADGKTGALVGKHRVSIGTKEEFLSSSPNLEPIERAAKGITEKVIPDPISAEWRGGVEFDVPAGGTSKADFEVGMPPKKK